jgi:dienelactone hydrolase
MNRRCFLVAGAASGAAVIVGGVALTEARVLPGRARLNQVLGGCGEPLAAPSATRGTRVDGTIDSRARRTPVGYSVLVPPGSMPDSRMPVVLALHGRGGDHNWPVDALHLDGFLAGAAAADPPARFAIVTVDGGDDTNWHARTSGDDPLAMVTDELLPTLGSSGLDVTRLGIIGWSLGGAGALLLADRLGASRCVAVVASSPAIWTDVAATGAGTYDGPDDFAASRVDGLGGTLAGIPLRVDCGDLDPFAHAVTTFRHTLTPTPDGGIAVGCHDEAFWTRRLPEQLQFLSRHVGA